MEDQGRDCILLLVLQFSLCRVACKLDRLTWKNSHFCFSSGLNANYSVPCLISCSGLIVLRSRFLWGGFKPGAPWIGCMRADIFVLIFYSHFFFLSVSFFPPTLEPFIRSWMKDTSYRSQVDCALWGDAEPTVHMCRFLGRGSASLFGSQKRPEPSKIKDHCTEGRACFRHLLGFSFACPSALCGSLLFSHLHLECKYFLKNSKCVLQERNSLLRISWWRILES